MKKHSYLNNENAAAPQTVSNNELFIICAAIWYDDKIERGNLPRNIETGIVVSGWRHHNCFTLLSAIYPDGEYRIKNLRKGVLIQGFLTSKGFFVNRKEGGQIAFNANQIEKKTDMLFSEDLY